MSEFPHFADLLRAQNAISHIPSADAESALESRSLLSSGSPAPCPREAFKKCLLSRISRNRIFVFFLCSDLQSRLSQCAPRGCENFTAFRRAGSRRDKEGRCVKRKGGDRPFPDQAAAIQGGRSGGRGVSPSQGGLTDSRRPLWKAAADDPSRSPSTADPETRPHPRALGKNRHRFSQGASSQSFAFLPKALPKPRLASCPPTDRAGVTRP